MDWISQSGKTFSLRIQMRLNAYFNKVLEYYPDYNIKHFSTNHKKLSERAPELKRLAGYDEENKTFFEDFGFHYIVQKRTRNYNREPLDVLMARLRKQFPDKIKSNREMKDDYHRVLYYARKKSITVSQLLIMHDLLDTSKVKRTTLTTR